MVSGRALSTFLLSLALLNFFTPRNTPGAEAPVAPIKADESMQQTISAVYPVLAQILVITPQYGGGRERKFQAAGSGVIISTEGHIITNHHVAGKAVAIRCVLSTREEIDATLVGTDALADIAVLKLDLSARPPGSAPLPPPAKFGSSRELKIGDTVFAMGCPMAISQSVTRGIVSNKDMMIPAMWGEALTLEGEDVGSLVKWIGHDAQIFPGNSGGPLVNNRGEIVGINELGLGLAGAIPSEIANPVSQELIAHGSVRRAWIGAAFQPLLKSEAANPNARGVLLSAVVPGSPVEAAGLKPGDIVLAVDGAPALVRFSEQLPAFTMMILAKPVGQPIAFTVRRAGQELTISLKPESRDEAMGKEREAKEWGCTVRRLTVMEARQMRRADQKGVQVSSVRTGGPADTATPALAAGDVIVEAGGKQVTDIDAFFKLTAELTKDKEGSVPVVVAFDRGDEHGLTLIEVGIRPPQKPPAEASKAWLAVSTQVLSRRLAKALGLSGKKGVRINQVYENGNAQRAGFEVGDILTQIDSQPIEASEPQDSEVFETMIHEYKPGSKAVFAVVRDGSPLTITATLDTAPKTERELKVYEDIALEFKARDLSFADSIKLRLKANEDGAIVEQVDTGGWAAVGGLRAEDLIQAVDGAKITNIKELEAALKDVQKKRPREIVLFVKRGILTLFLELLPTWPENR